jgi:hypothetical protein
LRCVHVPCKWHVSLVTSVDRALSATGSATSLHWYLYARVDVSVSSGHSERDIQTKRAGTTVRCHRRARKNHTGAFLNSALSIGPAV